MPNEILEQRGSTRVFFVNYAFAKEINAGSLKNLLSTRE